MTIMASWCSGFTFLAHMRLLALGLMLSLSLIAQVAAQPITGNYAVAGTNFDGSIYTGTARITEEGSTCRIIWHTGSTSSEGICMLSGRTLAAFHKLGSDYGVVSYDLQSDGSLQGRWSVAGKQGIGTERLIPKK